MSDLSFAADGSTFWAQFWPDLLATLIGAFVGIGLALKADRARERRARVEQEAALLRASRDAIQANLTMCAKLKANIQAGLQVPTFGVDVGLLDAILPRLVELSLDTKLLAELGAFRYELHNVSRKLDHLLEVSRLSESDTEALNRVGGWILGTIAALEGYGEQILPPLLDARLKALEPSPVSRWGFW